MTQVTIASINTKIATLAKAEKVTKATLAELSRDLLDYVLVQGFHDIAAVNRLLDVLTPMNKETARLFFLHFLPHNWNEDTNSFGGLNKKAKEKKLELTGKFLADETNTIWTWAADNIKVEAKEVDYLGKVTKAISQAIDKGHVSQLELVKAVLAGGVELSALTLLMQQAVAADAEGAEAMGEEQDIRAVQGIGVDQPELLAEVC